MKKAIVGVWASSSVSDATRMRRGLAQLRSLGVDPLVPPLTAKYAAKKESRARPFLAGPDAAKVRSLVTLWRNPKVNNIIATRGGYGSIRLLPALDQIALPANRAPRIWGFSDLTTVQHYFYKRFGTPWVHSPMLTSPSFLEGNVKESAFWRGDGAAFSHSVKKIFAPSSTRLPSQAPLIGGNLACLNVLSGSPWQLRPRKPFFLFLEEVGEKAYRLDRMLQQITNSGLLTNCAAVLLGHFTDCPGWQPIVELWARENKIPLYSGLLAGHESANIPLPMGVAVELEAKNSSRSVLKVPRFSLG